MATRKIPVSDESSGKTYAETSAPLSSYMQSNTSDAEGWTIYSSDEDGSSPSQKADRPLNLSVLKRLKRFLNEESPQEQSSESSFLSSNADGSYKVEYPFYDGESNESEAGRPSNVYSEGDVTNIADASNESLREVAQPDNSIPNDQDLGSNESKFDAECSLSPGNSYYSNTFQDIKGHAVEIENESKKTDSLESDLESKVSVSEEKETSELFSEESQEQQENYSYLSNLEHTVTTFPEQEETQSDAPAIEASFDESPQTERDFSIETTKETPSVSGADMINTSETFPVSQPAQAESFTVDFENLGSSTFDSIDAGLTEPVAPFVICSNQTQCRKNQDEKQRSELNPSQHSSLPIASSIVNSTCIRRDHKQPRLAIFQRYIDLVTRKSESSEPTKAEETNVNSSDVQSLSEDAYGEMITLAIAPSVDGDASTYCSLATM